MSRDPCARRMDSWIAPRVPDRAVEKGMMMTGTRPRGTVLELKYNHSAETAISQIHNNHYGEVLKDYVGDVVLVGINYDKDTKRHDCLIERWRKEE